MDIEITLEERIEAARARLKTAYDRTQEPGLNNPATIEYRKNIWLRRKSELELLLTNQNNTSQI